MLRTVCGRLTSDMNPHDIAAAPGRKADPARQTPRARFGPADHGYDPASMTADSDPYRRTLLGRADAAVLSRPAVRWLLAAAAAAVLIVPSVQFVAKIQEREFSVFRGEKLRSALGRWLADARALRDAEDPYGPGHWFPNPPLVLIALVPLTAMPVPAAGIVWAVAKVAATVAALAFLVRAYRRPTDVLPLGVIVMALVFSFRPIMSDLKHGNLNLFVLAAVAVCWALYVRGRDVPAGLFLALAITIKVTPALLLVYFACKRAWRVAAGAAAGLALFVAVLPSLCVGPARCSDLHVRWFNMLAAPYVLHGYVTTDILNQSLPGVLTRWMSASGFAMQTMDVDARLAAGMEEMARPATTAGRWLIRGAGLSVLAALAWLCRTATADRRDARLMLELALMLLAMLLLSERTWKHHLVTLPLVYLACWRALACFEWSARATGLLVAGMTLQFLLLSASAEGLLGERLADDLHDRGIILVGLLLCFVQTAVMLRRIPVRAGWGR